MSGDWSYTWVDGWFSERGGGSMKRGKGVGVGVGLGVGRETYK